MTDWLMSPSGQRHVQHPRGKPEAILRISTGKRQTSNGHYLNEIKLHRHKTGRMILPRSVKITPEGRYIVEHEPNLEDSTLTALRDTDWELLSVEDRIRVSSFSEKQLVEYAFLNTVKLDSRI